MTILSFDPRTGLDSGRVPENTRAEVDAVLRLAEEAAPAVAATAPARRRAWSVAIAAALRENAEDLVRIADAETALGPERLTSELERCAANWVFYAEVAAEGSYLDATIDSATGASPAIARVALPRGPVAVFGAGNFPFAFGVAGHDTASALAAGAPVVVKAHPAHPRLSIRLAEVVSEALRRAGGPAGAFAVVSGFDHGARLVQAPEVTAVAFTGSQAGGMHLAELSRSRPVPIPVYAEMGTVNPVVVLPGALPRLAEIAQGFVGSFTLGAGQFCTKPGLMLAPRGGEAAEHVLRALRDADPDPVMLTERIAIDVEERLRVFEQAGARVTRVGGRGAGWRAPAAVVGASAAQLQAGAPLLSEVFGAVAVIVEYDGPDAVRDIVANLQNCLAASVFADPDTDPEALRDTVDLLARRAGRVIVDGWPTGVACTWAQHHGGGWPATTDPQATSVGARALGRFVRPVAYQSAPDEALPDPLRAGNPWRIPRRIDGILQPAEAW